MKQTVLITGVTGLVGKALTKALVKKGYKVIILTRNAAGKDRHEQVQFAVWSVQKQQIDITALQQADYIIHLAGAGVVEKKWTAAYKKEIQDSRTESSSLIYEALKNNENKVKAIISASAIGWYGADTEPVKPFTEDATADDSFLGQTCKRWEAGIEPVTTLGKRLVKFRIGIVLSNDGGALAEFKKRDDKWFAEVDPSFFGRKPTNNYCKWFHVCEHEANHRGQITLVKKRLPGRESSGD